MKYDEMFLKILISSVDILETITELRKGGVLNEDELSFCRSCTSDIELYGKVDIVTKAEFTTDNNYTRLEYYDLLGQFIETRKKELDQKLLEEINCGNIYSSETITLFLNRYSEQCTTVDLSYFEDLSLFSNEVKEDGLSTCVDIIDTKIGGGLLPGTITSIVSGDDKSNSLWTLNIAYEALKSGKNVVYLTSRELVDKVYEKFLIRHSTESQKFNDRLFSNDINCRDSRDLIMRVQTDFNETLLKNIVFYDIKDMIVQNTASLRRLLASAYKHFHGYDEDIDLIVIDGLDKFSFYNGKKNVTNSNLVIDEYLTYLRNFSNDMFNLKNKCIVVCSNNTSDNGLMLHLNNGNCNTKQIHEKILFHADNILSIYTSGLESEENAKVQVVKSLEGKTMERSISHKIDFSGYRINNCNDSLQDNNYLKLENKTLKETNDFLSARVNNADKQIERILKEKDPEALPDEFIFVEPIINN